MAEKCSDHSGCLTDIEHLQKSDEEQWRRINEIKDRDAKILTAVVMTLIATVINLCIQVYAK